MKMCWKNESLKKKVEKYAKSNRVTRRRMVSIEAADSFCDLVPASAGRAHFLRGSDSDRFAIDIAEKRNGKRLICEPHGLYKKDANGQFIKSSIREIMILKIEDYHT